MRLAALSKYLLMVVSSLAVVSGTAQADDRADFDALVQQMQQASDADNFPATVKAGRRLLTIIDRVNPKKRPYLLWQVAVALRRQDKDEEAVPLLVEAIKLYEANATSDPVELASSRSELAGAYSRLGKFAEAEVLFHQAIAAFRKALGPSHATTLGKTGDLALMYQEAGRLDEAVALNQQLIKTEEAALGKNAAELVHPLSNLGQIYKNQGLYDKAEPMYRRALGIQLQTVGPNHPTVADTLHRLGILYMTQLRYAEAEAVMRRVIEIREAYFGPDSSRLALVISNLALIKTSQEKYSEALPLIERALALYEGDPSTDPREIAKAVADLGFVELSMDRNAAGEKTLRRALALYEKCPGFNDPMIGHISMKLSHALVRQNRWAEAEVCVERSRKIAEASGESLLGLFDIYFSQAKILWHTERRDEALKVLRKALDIAEVQRQHASGGDVDQATLFADCVRGFEMMIQCQLERGDAAGAAETIERFRARTLMDEMRTAGVDLLADASAEERAAIAQQETELQQQLANLAANLQDLPPDTDGKPGAQRQALLDEMAATRERLYLHYRDVRSESEVYRQLITRETQLPSLPEIQQSVASADSLVLSYFIGQGASYVVAIDGSNTKVYPLVVSEATAERLKMIAGPLYHSALQWLLMNANQDGVLQQLSSLNTAERATPKLAQMWELLVPAELRERIVSGQIKRLVVLPDGPLALLPFECLIVKLGEHPTGNDREYLLDVGPPIAYGPSASVLMNLLARPKTELEKSQASVLTVGDPAYREPTAVAAPQPLAQQARAKLATTQQASRQAKLRSGFKRLPYSGTESRWVSQVFEKNGQTTRQLIGATATEAQIRSQATGKYIVHLACHGVADDDYGNLFGALALTPGAKANVPTDDGLLTLGEIYDLDLRGCELAILSACMTNYGPQQQGEGVWALSRGFLVAGARRVVASNWVVDDEAAATLISLYCASIAKSQAAQDEGNKDQVSSRAVDYATALQTAKRQVRKQDKWRSPYYWGTFVLIGPS